MPPRNRTAFNEIIVQAIRRSGWTPVFVGAMSACPFRIAAVQGENSINLSVYLWSVTHGGKTRNPNEYRIQVQVDEFVVNHSTTLVLGWWEQGQVFAAFDVQKHLGRLGDNSSIQVSLQTLQKAAIDGFAVQAGKGNEEVVAVFKSEFFAAYASNAAAVHGLGTSSDELRALMRAVNVSENASTIGDDLPELRQSVLRTVSKKIRASNFREKVLRAYDHRCAFCSMQLDLIDAAHILPVAIDTSTDDTSNGVALCALHHRAYDAGLITMLDDYSVLINNQSVQKLRELNRSDRFEYFRDGLLNPMGVPPNPADRPKKEFILAGNRVRGW